MRERVLTNDFIWLCSTCYDRWPQDVQLTGIMTTLKKIAARKKIHSFHSRENRKRFS